MKYETTSLIIDLTANLNNVFLDTEAKKIFTLNKSTVDPTEYFTALLYAFSIQYEAVTGNKDMNLLEFTHFLNGVAVQHLMEHGTIEEA